ncbi:hypothetical protein COX84_02410 [Candidatus Micrarchaeota archaeon CG_4_10_14_0_2_um_filter_49_7]|nr:MAG: hypothetical protein COX84_02410 [Candidatus Micrarchaeota archaeon CG_4_10_14_0_2_um_filter_49_7]
MSGINLSQLSRNARGSQTPNARAAALRDIRSLPTHFFHEALLDTPDDFRTVNQPLLTDVVGAVVKARTDTHRKVRREAGKTAWFLFETLERDILDRETGLLLSETFSLIYHLRLDVGYIIANDPALKPRTDIPETANAPRTKWFDFSQTLFNILEALTYQGLQASTIHKTISHPLYIWYQSHPGSHPFLAFGARFLARSVSRATYAHTSIDIHPGAKVGIKVGFDHGVGTVIGETAEVGHGAWLLHGNTLGGQSGDAVDRHPKIDPYSTVGAGNIILGPYEVGRGATIGAGSPPVIVTRNGVPAGVTVRGGKAEIPQPPDRGNGNGVNSPLQASTSGVVSEVVK